MTGKEVVTRDEVITPEVIYPDVMIDVVTSLSVTFTQSNKTPVDPGSTPSNLISVVVATATNVKL